MLTQFIVFIVSIQPRIIDWFLKFLRLKSDSHAPENFYQIKTFPSHVRKSTIICLFGV